jgi:cell division protein ZapA (FtsZ GTPase activity inhibitor)
MIENNLVRFNMQVGGRSFPVKVQKNEVEGLRKIEKRINDRINEMMMKYPGYDRLDIFTMAFISIIFELNESSFESTAQEFEKRLEKVVTLLDTSL